MLWVFMTPSLAWGWSLGRTRKSKAPTDLRKQRRNLAEYGRDQQLELLMVAFSRRAHHALRQSPWALEAVDYVATSTSPSFHRVRAAMAERSEMAFREPAQVC